MRVQLLERFEERVVGALVAAQQRAVEARHRVVLSAGREREGVLRVEVILVLRVGARGLGEARTERLPAHP